MDAREAAVLLQREAAFRSEQARGGAQSQFSDSQEYGLDCQRRSAALYAAARIAYQTYQFNLPRWLNWGGARDWSDPPPEGMTVEWR